jgi:hypothetical protein
MDTTMLDNDDDMRSRIEAALANQFRDEVIEEASLEKMGGHASMRIYWRVKLPVQGDATDWSLNSVRRSETTLVAMVLAPGWDEADSEEGPASEDVESESLPFLEMQRYLADLGIPVPAIELVDLDEGVMLLEDLGDRTFEDLYRGVSEDDTLPPAHQDAAGTALYQQAVDLIVQLQSALVERRGRDETSPTDGAICWRRSFDRESLRWELDHFAEWCLDEPLPDDADAAFDDLVGELLDLPDLPSLRDFQSRNLMYKPRMDQGTPWVVIDFQDALMAPMVYDVVCLLRDSYIELPIETVQELLDYYLERGRDAELPWCSARGNTDRDPQGQLHRAFHLQTIQRKLKDAGRFIYIDRVKDNDSFLPYVDPSLDHVLEACHHLEGWEPIEELVQRVTS